MWSRDQQSTKLNPRQVTNTCTSRGCVHGVPDRKRTKENVKRNRHLQDLTFPFPSLSLKRKQTKSDTGTSVIIVDRQVVYKHTNPT